MSNPVEPLCCPFCGKPGTVVDLHVSVWTVRCSDEECVSRRPTRSNASAAIEAWNRRQPDADLLAACEDALSVGELLDRPDDENQRIYLGKKTIACLRAAIAKATKGAS